MSFPIDWTGAPDDSPSTPFFPDVDGWTKVIKSSPGTIEDVGSGFPFTHSTQVPWTDVTHAADNDGAHSASVEVGVGGLYPASEEAQNADCLYVHDWGFAIPSGATIQAVLISINGTLLDSTAEGNDVNKIAVYPFALNVDGAWCAGIGLSNIPPNFTPPGTAAPGTDAAGFTSLPGAADGDQPMPAEGGLLVHLHTPDGYPPLVLTAAQVNAAGFGPGFSISPLGFVDSTDGTQTVNIYAMAIAVYYTLPSGSGGNVEPELNSDAMFNSAVDSSLDFLYVYDTANGKILKETPVGSGTLTDPFTATLPYALPTGAFMQALSVYEKTYCAIGDLVKGLARPVIIDGKTGNAHPFGQVPIGFAWQKNYLYLAGDMVAPTVPNGHLYQCTTTGTSDPTTEPTWPLTTGGTVSDGTTDWKETTPTFASSSTAGNICAGVRYAMVLFRNWDESISGAADDGTATAAVVPITVAADGFSLDCVIPLGPAGTMSRPIALTVAGGSPAGPFFIIPDAFIEGGLLNDATEIKDNTTTSVTLNFTDTVLLSSLDVTDRLGLMPPPYAADVAYSTALRKMVFTGVPGYESGHLFSETDDPESINGSSDVVQVSETEGGKTVCFREIPVTAMQLSLKENGGYEIIPDDVNPPAKWVPKRLWTGSGPCGPRAVGLASSFVVYAHKSGLWRYTGASGDPVRVSDEIYTTWSRIDWDNAQAVSVHVDEVAKEIRVAVPIVGTPGPTKTLTLNYFQGWDPPAITNIAGQLIPGRNSRKWSVDDTPGHQIITAKRTLATPIDPRINSQQILRVWGNAVKMIVPDLYNDDGAGIDQQYTPALAQDPVGSVIQWVGVTGHVKGNGNLVLNPVTDDPTFVYYRNASSNPMLFPLSAINAHFVFGLRLSWEHASINYTNGAVADSHFELHASTLFGNPLFASRRGSGI